MPFPLRRHSLGPLARTCFGLPLVLLAVAGCHQGQVYQASSLPAEFIGPRMASVQRVDLSTLATSVSNSEVVHPGDVVEITIATGIEQGGPLSTKVRVSEDGLVTVPLVGPVQIAGLDFTRAEQLIRDESIRRGKYVSPNVSVILDTPRTNRITVVGAVEEPGTYELPAPNSDVLNAIVLAKGLSKEAGTTIEIRHPPGMQLANATGSAMSFTGYGTPASYATPSRTVRIDLERANLYRRNEFHLEDGATVMVMNQGKQYIHVIGLVNRPDQFELPNDQELRLLDAIALAGGRTLEIADTVHVVRRIPNREEPVVIEASVREAKQSGSSNIRLTAGDVVSVEETPVTFVVGSLRDFVRFGFSSALPLF